MQFNIAKLFALASATAVVCSNAAVVDKRDAEFKMGELFSRPNGVSSIYVINQSIVPTGCINLPSNVENRAQSISVVNGIVCKFFTIPNCGGNSITVGSPVVNLPFAFANAITSYSCNTV
ncbi:hypothetical protein QCA50_014334 [Cerrena zonata]|uniref:Uncharacterized protein n=1 Tax=Cerrena zonata TaxID=2478898 RepID=A0AAW0FU37_9APHY